jgi:hypothetical protein
LAYTEITGGDGETGQSGEVVKNILNATHLELYAAIEEVFSRAFTEELLFDKPEIYYAPYVQSGDINFTLAGSGHLVNNSSGARMTIAFDGVSTINVSSAFNEIIGFENGDIIPPGTRKVYFLYVNGEVSINIPGVTSQAPGITKLETPGSFAVTPDGENALDLSWVDVADEVQYQIERSLTGSSGWVLYSNPAADATSDTETGLSPGDIVYYRIKAIGYGTIHSDSNYAYANGQTENVGDITAPTFIFDPVNGVSTWSVNKPLTITANEPIRNANGTAITSANVASVITLKLTNSGGADIAFTATIDASKTIITVTPTTIYGNTVVVYVAVHDVEDNDGNEISGPISITFTTTAFTYYNGASSRLNFGDMLDTVWALADTVFRLKITIKNHVFTSTRVFIGKADLPSNQRSWMWISTGVHIYFIFYGLRDGTAVRSIKWDSALVGGELVMQLDYNGALDTNEGLDRCVLTINGVVQGSKTVDSIGSSMAVMDAIDNTTASLASGNLLSASGIPGSSYWFSGEAKDIEVSTNSGSTIQISVPVIASGTDVSGNNRHGTWVS